MTNFKEFFEKSTVYPLSVYYKDRRIFVADKFPVANKDTLIISMESSNSKYTQGAAVDVYGYCKVVSSTHRKGKHVNILFWEDAELVDPKHIEIQVYTKKGFVYIQNIWEAEATRPYVLSDGEMKACYVGSAFYDDDRWVGAAMYSEEIEGGRRYFCSDGDGNDNFDSIIFTVRIKK